MGKYITNNYGKAVPIIQKKCLEHGLKFQVISIHVYKKNEVENQVDKSAEMSLMYFFAYVLLNLRLVFIVMINRKSLLSSL